MKNAPTATRLRVSATSVHPMPLNSRSVSQSVSNDIPSWCVSRAMPIEGYCATAPHPGFFGNIVQASWVGSRPQGGLELATAQYPSAYALARFRLRAEALWRTRNPTVARAASEGASLLRPTASDPLSRRYSALMFANLTTLAHLSISSAVNLP